MTAALDTGIAVLEADLAAAGAEIEQARPTVAKPCRCNHGSVWHIGAGRCVATGCRCARLHRLSSFEQLPTAEAQEAYLTDKGFAPRQQGEGPELDKVLGGRR